MIVPPPIPRPDDQPAETSEADSAYEPTARCPNCQSDALYTTRTSAGTPHGPNLLPHLGTILSFASFDVVVCADCGNTQFFADPDSRQKPANASGWQKLVPRPRRKGFVAPDGKPGIDPGANEWQAFVKQTVEALAAAGFAVGKETRGENLFLEKAGIWLDLAVYFEHRKDSDCISRIVERAVELSRE